MAGGRQDVRPDTGSTHADAPQAGAARSIPRILVVEDDDAVGEELVAILGAYRMEAHRVADWPSAIAFLKAGQVDLIILDQWLGHLDSLTVLPVMRPLTAAPIVILAGKSAEADRIVGLEVGADDFLQKPMSGREIVARVRAHLRRIPSARSTEDSGAWRIVPALRRVLRPDGEPLPLTGTEYDLLSLLMETPGQPVDRDTLSRRVLQRPYSVDDRALDNLVHNIRLKFGDGVGVGVIATVRTKGYAFTGFPGTA